MEVPQRRCKLCTAPLQSLSPNTTNPTLFISPSKPSLGPSIYPETSSSRWFSVCGRGFLPANKTLHDTPQQPLFSQPHSEEHRARFRTTFHFDTAAFLAHWSNHLLHKKKTASRWDFVIYVSFAYHSEWQGEVTWEKCGAATLCWHLFFIQSKPLILKCFACFTEATPTGLLIEA